MIRLEVILVFAVLLTPVLGAGCLDSCAASSNCTQAGIFGTCESCVDYGSGGKCMTNATCSNSCSVDSDCWDGHAFTENCAYCINGTCNPLQDCGGVCASSDDCLGFYYSNYECRSCVNGVCSAGCGIGCNSDNDCRGNYPCQICAAGNNTCQEYQSCGGPCKYDSQCDAHGSCPDCKDGACSPPASCGDECGVGVDCFRYGDCPDCMNSTCSYYDGCNDYIVNGTCYDLPDCNYEYCYCVTLVQNNTGAYCLHPNSTQPADFWSALRETYPDHKTQGSVIGAFRPDQWGIFRTIEFANEEEEAYRSGKKRSFHKTASVTEEVVDGDYYRLVGSRRHMTMPYHEAKIFGMTMAERAASVVDAANTNVEKRKRPDDE